MSIMDFFRAAPPAAPATAQTAEPGQTPPPVTQPQDKQQQAQQTQQPQAAPSQQATGTESPFDKFADLWKTDPNANQQTQPLLSVDPQKIQEAAAQINFANAIPKENFQKIAAGGEDAVKAFMESMNLVAQTTFAHSALATSKIVEQTMAKAKERYDAEIPGMVKKLQVSESLRSENPVFNNPAVSPLISAMEAQFTQKFPNASAEEIKAMAKDYIATVATALSPQKPSDGKETQQQDGEYDWSGFLPDFRN